MDDEEKDEEKDEEEKEVEVEKPKKKRKTSGKEEAKGAAIEAGDKPTEPTQPESPMTAKPTQKKIRAVLEKTHSPKPAAKQSPPKSPAVVPKSAAAVPKKSPPPGTSSCDCVVCFKYIVTVRV